MSAPCAPSCCWRCWSCCPPAPGPPPACGGGRLRRAQALARRGTAGDQTAKGARHSEPGCAHPARPEVVRETAPRCGMRRGTRCAPICSRWRRSAGLLHGRWWRRAEIAQGPGGRRTPRSGCASTARAPWQAMPPSPPFSAAHTHAAAGACCCLAHGVPGFAPAGSLVAAAIARASGSGGHTAVTQGRAGPGPSAARPPPAALAPAPRSTAAGRGTACLPAARKGGVLKPPFEHLPCPQGGAQQQSAPGPLARRSS